MKNTIEREISPRNLANEVLMQRSQGYDFIVLVEGQSDASIYKRVIDGENFLLQINFSKGNLLHVADLLKDEEIKFFGIIDKDFDYLLGHNNENEFLFYTDENDLEGMIIFCDVFSTIYDNLVDEQLALQKFPDGAASCRDLVTELSASVGSLRLASIQSGISLSLSRTRIPIRVDSLSLDEDEIIRRALNNWSEEDAGAILSASRLAKKTNALRDLSRGHDFIQIFAKLINGVIGKQNAFDSRNGNKLLEKVFFIAYSKEDFEKTALAAKIRAWLDKFNY